MVEQERKQASGRLDLMLASVEGSRRYEVELMLGPTDESHIVRCIEYWDIERRRYPGYEHCAVLIAEDITSRFLNVLSLMAGTVPLIAIQLNALVLNNQLVLNFVRVLDQRLQRRDDLSDTKLQAVSRETWVDKTSNQIIQIADDILLVINDASVEAKYQLNYNKYYIGLTDGIRSRNFIYFRPRKKFIHVVVPNGWTAERAARFEKAGLEADQDDDKLLFTLSPGDLPKNIDLVSSVIGEVVAEL